MYSPNQRFGGPLRSDPAPGIALRGPLGSTAATAKSPKRTQQLIHS
jgi:hypothetical protein